MGSQIGVRELRNDVSEVLRRVESGEEFVVTVRGRPIARLVGLDQKPTTMPAKAFFEALENAAADPKILDDIKDATAGTTDDVNPWSD